MKKLDIGLRSLCFALYRPPLFSLFFLTSATGCAALCTPTLCPRVGWPRVSGHAGVRLNLVGVGFLFSYDIVGDVTLVDLLNCLGWVSGPHWTVEG